MYTKDFFCGSVLKTNYSDAIQITADKHYKTFYIPKKNGSREISFLNRNDKLAILQRNLIENFLKKQPLPVCVKGFVKGENYNTYLQRHVGAKYFLRLDIKDFFPSLKKETIIKSINEILKFDLADSKREILELIGEIVTKDGTLPQGAYSSPVVSNIVMTKLDQRILKYCQAFGIKYTRYADDMLFSSESFCFEKKKWFIKKIKYILSSKNLNLNYGKIKYAENELSVNGYVIYGKGIRLSRNRLHDIRKIVAFVKDNYMMIKSGNEEEFITNINEIQLLHRDLSIYRFNTVFQVAQYMCGYRAYLISMVDENCKETVFQRDLQKLIRKIEKQIINLEQINF